MRKWVGTILAMVVVFGLAMNFVSASQIVKMWTPKDKAPIGQEGIFEVDIANTFNTTMEVRITFEVPSNVMVSSSDASISGSGGIYIAKLTVSPDSVSRVKFNIMSQTPGTYDISASVDYFTEDGQYSGHLSYYHTFTFENTLKSEIENMDLSLKTVIIGFIALIIILAVLKKL